MAEASSSNGVMSPIDMLIMAVPGRPGEDYPILASVPETSFDCEGRTEGGYYADVEAGCQPFHVCANDGGKLSKFSFLCPNGTLFSQETFTCEWWFNVDCEASESLYSLNEDRLASSSDQQSYNTQAPASNYNSPSTSLGQAKAVSQRRPPPPSPNAITAATASTRPSYASPPRTNEGHHTTRAQELPPKTTIKALPSYSSSNRGAATPPGPTQPSYGAYEDQYDEYEYYDENE